MSIKIEKKNLEIDPKLSVGATLKYCRIENAISIRDVVLALKVKERDIIDLENDKIFSKRSNTYVNGLVRSYANLLKIDSQLIREKLSVLGMDASVIDKGRMLDIEGDQRYAPSKKYLFYAALLLLIIYFFMFQDFGAVGVLNTKAIIERISQ